MPAVIITVAVLTAPTTPPVDAVPVPDTRPAPYTVEFVGEDEAPGGDPMYRLRTARGTITRPDFGRARVVQRGHAVHIIMDTRTVAPPFVEDVFRFIDGRPVLARHREGLAHDPLPGR